MPLSNQIESDQRLHADRFEYEDQTVYAIETAQLDATVDVDIVGDTAILILETANGSDQHEFELPSDDATAFIKNGIVTIEVNK